MMFIIIFWRDEQDTNVLLYVANAFQTLYALRHWVFIYFYLEAACLFKMTFLTHSDDDFERLKARKRNLLCVRILGYVVIIGMGFTFGGLVLFSVYEVQTLLTVWYAQMSFIYVAGAILTFYSFYLINKNSASIEKIGVRRDSLVMKLYSIFWGTGAIFKLAQFFLLLVIACTDDHDTLFVERISVVVPIFGIICWLDSFGLDMLMLLSYNRFGRKIS